MHSDGRETGVLIVIKDSKSCQEAEEYLRSTGFRYKLADAQELGILSSLNRDIGISMLPALLTSSGTFEGLEDIKAATKSNGGTARRKGIRSRSIPP